MLFKNKNKLPAAALFIIISQLPSEAYIDPGTGSLAVQILIAGIAGAACWIKIQWQNIKGFCIGLCRKKK